MREIFVINSAEKDTAKKIRTAAYCRVSSSSEEQLASFSSQVREYTTRIEQESTWEMVDIYADEGITGTSMTKRPEFQRLLADCRRGLIDCIITKSISRFARNVKECLSVLRELKDLEINVIFEKEGINTSDLSGEMLVTVFGAIAQEESTSIGSNMKWSYEKRMQAGKSTGCKAPYGYKLENENLVIDEPKAEIIRWIFESYLAGKGIAYIIQELNGMGESITSKKQWYHFGISYILKNEKYCGDLMLQKRHIIGTLDERRSVPNRGELPMYYTQNTHPPIVSREMFQKAKSIMEDKAVIPEGSIKGQSAFTNIYCKECGSTCKSRIRKNGDTVWTCRAHDKKSSLCDMKPVPEQTIIRALSITCQILKADDFKILNTMVTQCTLREKRIISKDSVLNEIKQKILDVSGQILVLDRLKTKGMIDVDEHKSKLNQLDRKMRELKKQHALHNMDRNNESKADATISIINALRNSPENLTDLDDGGVFSMIVERVKIDKDKNIIFRLINGLELGGF